MYIELTPEDTIKDLRSLLIEAIPGFEFPRKNLYDYTLNEVIKYENEVLDTDFIIGILWDDEISDNLIPDIPQVMIEASVFNCDLTSEEINILAILMMCAWTQRQVTSIENIRMKYSGNDFKFTSQANHLSKLLSLLSECQRQSHHMQRLYKRRKLNNNGEYESNWSCLRYDQFT